MPDAPNLYSTGRTAPSSISTASARPDNPNLSDHSGIAREYPPPSFAPMAPAVNPPVRSRTPHRMCVVAPHAVAVDEGALPGAVHEVLDRRNGDDRFGHRRSVPNALVVSAVPLRTNWMLCHAACTPVRGHAAFLSGFQMSMSASMPS